MRPPLMAADEFCAYVIERVRNERSDLEVRHLHGLFLLVEHMQRQRVVSLANLYQRYTLMPEEIDLELTNFLATLVYAEPPGIKGGFEENRMHILPQIVPPSLITFCRRDGRGLPVVPFVGDLSIAFVVDEASRYCYVNDLVLSRWGVRVDDLLEVAMENLRAATDGVELLQIGMGETAMYLYESFDGYDASRILLDDKIKELAALVSGPLVVGIPNRDFLVAFGGANPEFVRHMWQQMQEQNAGHSYAICPDLLLYEEGNWSIYTENTNETRVVN